MQLAGTRLPDPASSDFVSIYIGLPEQPCFVDVAASTPWLLVCEASAMSVVAANTPSNVLIATISGVFGCKNCTFTYSTGKSCTAVALEAIRFVFVR